MKKFLMFVIAAALVLNPLASYSAPQNDGVVSAHDFKKVIGDVEYSLDTMPAVLDDLKMVDLQGGKGITKTASQSMYLRLSAAIELMHAISADTKMTEKQKDAVQIDLFTHIGSAMYRVLRQHGNDKVDPMATTIVPLGGVLTVEGALEHFTTVMKEFLLDAKSVGTFVRSNDLKKQYSADAAYVAALRQRELRREQIEDEIAELQENNQATPDKLAKEIDELNAAQVQDERSYKLVWKPLERVRRVQLGEQVIESFSEIASRYVPAMVKDEEAQGHYVKFWAQKHIPNMTTLRQNRVAAQISTQYALLGMAAASFLTPDFIGMVTGRTMWTRPITSIILMTSLGVLGAIKGQTVGRKIVRELRELLSIMTGKASYVRADLGAKTPGERFDILKGKLGELGRASVEKAIGALPSVPGLNRATALAGGLTCEGLFGP